MGIRDRLTEDSDSDDNVPGSIRHDDEDEDSEDDYSLTHKVHGETPMEVATTVETCWMHSDNQELPTETNTINKHPCGRWKYETPSKELWGINKAPRRCQPAQY